jgi:hypothetical protein
MHRTPVIAAALVFVLAGACSQQEDPTADELQDDLVEQLREADDSLDADQADCYAGLLVKEIGVEDIVDVKFSAEEPSDEIADGIAAAAVAAREECGLTDPPR